MTEYPQTPDLTITHKAALLDLIEETLNVIALTIKTVPHQIGFLRLHSGGMLAHAPCSFAKFWLARRFSHHTAHVTI